MDFTRNASDRIMAIRRFSVALALVTSGAFPVFGQTTDVWEEVSNYKGWPVARFELSGVDKDTAKQLSEGLDMADDESGLYERHLREDIDRIKLYLARHGYPYARVQPGVEPHDERREITLVLEIDPGPAVTVHSYAPVAVPDEHVARVQAALRFRAGDVLIDEDLQSDVETVVEELKKEGHAHAQAAAAIEWLDTTSVDIRIVTAPGPVCYFRAVTVEGVPEDLIPLAHTLVDIKRGERFQPRTMTDAQNFLSRTGLFRQIRLTLETVLPDTLDLRVELKARDHRSIETGVGYWSDERFSGRVRWAHRNVFRRGRGTSIEIVYTQFRQWGEWSVWWPALFGSKKSIGTVRGGVNNENEDSYELLAPAVGVSYGYNFTRRSSATLSYTISRASYEIKTTESDFFENPKGPVAWFELRLSRDGTDDRIAPTEGTYTWLRVEFGPPGGISESNWILTELNGSYLLRLGATVLATNLRGGWGKPLGPATSLLPDRRFYAGGSTSHRGFFRRKLGPKDVNGAPLGGEVYATGFFEYRFPIAWKFNGAVFLDWGQVWQTRSGVDDKIEIAIGPALRIVTPVGPLRFDWGIRLTDYDDTTSKSQFHFAIGYPM
jgi:outer membrane protein assembly complex protein YaeT